MALTWVVIALLVTAAVAYGRPRQYPQGHPKRDKRHTRRSLALLAFVPAVFLFIGMFVAIGLLASILFWGIWLAALIFVVFIAKKDGFAGALIANVLALLIVLLSLFSFGWATVTNEATPAPAASQPADNVGGEEAREQAPPGTGDKPATCDPKFVQKWEENPDYRVISGGLYEDVTHKKITPEYADRKQREIVARDARVLAGYAHQEGLRGNASYADLLTPDKKCLSKEGIALYERLMDKWDTSRVTIAQAPAGATNTGMENGRIVSNPTSGIEGDRTAIKRTYTDSKGTHSTYTLVRCGNPLFPGKPKHVPPGHTDQHKPKPPKETTPPTPTPSTSTTPPPTTSPPTSPPPSTTPPTTTPPTTTPPTTTPPTTTPPTTTPPETCPPGQTGTPPDCVVPKDPEDDKHDEGNDGQTPAEEPPADDKESTTPVETEPADPTNKPTDEVPNVPADGATQKPTQEETNDPAPTATGAPPEDDKGEEIEDPGMVPTSSSTSTGNAAAGMLAIPLVGLAGLLRRRRVS